MHAVLCVRQSAIAALRHRKPDITGILSFVVAPQHMRLYSVASLLLHASCATLLQQAMNLLLSCVFAKMACQRCMGYLGPDALHKMTRNSRSS